MPISDFEYTQLARNAAEALAMWQAPMTDWQLRNVVVTPFRGAYGTAGLIFALEGTPPRALVAMLPDHDSALETRGQPENTPDTWPFGWQIVPIARYPADAKYLTEKFTSVVADALSAFATAWWTDYMERKGISKCPSL